MNNYVGVKLIKAKPMNLGDYNIARGWTIPENEDPARNGYMVKYLDGYVSWSPKEIFERSYMQVGNNNTITQDNVDDFIAETHIMTLGDKTVVVKVVLVNGFVIVESSSCVDPKNFDIEIGKEICLERIKNKIWELLGFVLSCGVNGIGGDE